MAPVGSREAAEAIARVRQQVAVVKRTRYKPKPHKTPEEVRSLIPQIEAMLLAGEPRVAVAKALGVQNQTVHAAARRLRIGGAEVKP